MVGTKIRDAPALRAATPEWGSDGDGLGMRTETPDDWQAAAFRPYLQQQRAAVGFPTTR